MKVKDGSVLVYYCFDAADEVQLDRIEKIFGKVPKESRLDYQRVTPEYVQYKKAPLLIKLGKFEKKIGEKIFSVECDVKIYDFGAITVRFSVPVANYELGFLKELGVDIAYKKALENKAVEYFEKIRNEIKDSLIMPNKDAEWEDYLIFAVKEFDQKIGVRELMKSKEIIAKILKGEENELSKKEMDDAVKEPLSYFKDDIAIINWNATFIYDPKMGSDVIDIIEFAVLELLELRVYDAVLDRAVEKAYDYLDFSKKKTFYAPPSNVLKYLVEVKLGVSEIIEKVENSLKLIGDPFLAKVYSTASSRFFLEKWKTGVKEKLNTINATYSFLWERANTNRMIILEVAIVVLFVMDILLFLFELFLK